MRLIDADKIPYQKNSHKGEIGYHFAMKYDIDNLPTVQAIPKAEYEARSKADMIAMLVRLNNEIDDLRAYDDIETVDKCEEIIQKKINEIEGNEDGND